MTAAANAAQALHHALRGNSHVEVASQDDIAELAGNGVKVETAGSVPATATE